MIQNTDEEYISCEYLQSGLNFHSNLISTCGFHTKGLIFIFCDPKSPINISYEEIEKKRLEVIENRQIPEGCQGCFNLKKKKWSQADRKIKIINIDNWRQCNCGCIYCSNRGREYQEFLSDKVTKSRFYDVLPILKEAEEKNFLSEDLSVYTTGGEPSSLLEYSDIINLLLKNKYKQITMLSSGIELQPSIQKALEDNRNNVLIISLDCGTRETYKKIKQIDAFDKCISNIKKYIQHAYSEYQVILKYIILTNINDNTEEIDKFFDIAKDVGCRSVVFSIEFCNSLEKRKGEKIPQKIYELFDYAEKKAKEMFFVYSVIDTVKDILKRGHY